MPKRPFLIALVVLVACAGSSGKTPTATPVAPNVAEVHEQPVPLWPDIRKGRLANGLTYYVLKHANPQKRALLWMAVDAGSVQEDDDQRGLAHFVEHMAFKGTKRYKGNDLIKYLESVGMRFGVDLNADTSWDETVYKLEVPTDNPEPIAKGLNILRDWAGDITFDPQELEKERGVVLEEWRLGRGAQMRLFDKHAKVQFKGSRYADRITIGIPEIIKTASRDALVRYYKDWYRPELMAVFAVGDFDAATIENEIKTRFRDLKSPVNPRPRTPGGVPPATGTRVSIETDREATDSSVTIINQIAKRPEATKRDIRRILTERLYASTLSERLTSIGRRPEASFMHAFANIGGGDDGRDIESFVRSSDAKDGKLEDTLRVLLSEVMRLETYGVTATEFDRARVNMVRSYEQSAKAMSTRESLSIIEEMTRNFLEGEFMIGDEREKELALEILPTVTLAEVNQAGAAFGGAENRVVLISAPEGKPLPDNERVVALLNEVRNSKLDSWEDRAPTKSLMARTPVPGTIKNESRIGKIGITEWVLSNGVRVVVKPTDFEIDSVQILGSSPGGRATAQDKDFIDARWADTIVSVGGLGEHDAEALSKLLTGKQVHVSASIDEVTESVAANGSARDIGTLMQLIHLTMTAPRKDDQAIAAWRANYREQMTNIVRSPEIRFIRESQHALWKGNVRRTPPEPADLDKIDVDKAIAFYNDRFGNAGDFTFVIVGAVKLDELRPLVETYLASLPTKGHKEKDRDLGIRRIGGIAKKEFEFSSDPKATVKVEFYGPQRWTREDDRDISILAHVVQLRLREVLREDKGAVYDVEVWGGISRSPPEERTFSVSFGCDPNRVDELTKTVFAEFEGYATKDLPAETLEAVKQAIIRSREVKLRQNRFWLDWLSSAFRYGDDPTLVLDMDAVTKRITPAHIKASAKRYLSTTQYFQAVMLPKVLPTPLKTPSIGPSPASSPRTSQVAVPERNVGP